MKGFILYIQIASWISIGNLLNLEQKIDALTLNVNYKVDSFFWKKISELKFFSKRWWWFDVIQCDQEMINRLMFINPLFLNGNQL